MDLSQEFIDVLKAVTKKRARFVIDTILEKGYCSTEDLKNAGYEHAPVSYTHLTLPTNSLV